ncbi:MAG: membrane dipeptidase, partial [Acidobacteriota bacterium]|nr:membrane dipeptidase [Acidobacteriota bacterium]
MRRRAKFCAVALAAAAVCAALAGCRMTENKQTPGAATPAPAAGSQAGGPPARRPVTIDMHADTVQFMLDEGADINVRRTDTHLDAERMREGGLDAQFFSIWVEPNLYGSGGARAVARADEQINAC